MTEYYITSRMTMASAAVAQGFEGVKSRSNYSDTKRWDKGLHVPEQNYAKWSFPKTPHNVALMEVRENDIVTWNEEPSYSELDYVGIASQVLNNGGSLYIKENRRKHHPYKSAEPVTIISRTINGKPAPMPVWDKEGV